MAASAGKLFALPVRRPVAATMFFLALALLGLFAWYRMPVELIPALSGEELYVQIYRPGSEPEAVEREILLPLEGRISELSGIDETAAEINGANARLTVRFERGSNHRVRELEINRIAADLQRTQPQGTLINVTRQDSSLISRLVLQLQISGAEDPASLREFVEERLQPRLASVPGVSQAFITGAPGREVTVWIDEARCAALGVQPIRVAEALRRSVQRLRYLGGSEEGGRRWSVMLDGRPGGVVSLGEVRVDPARPVLLRHVADIEMGPARQDSLFRVDGRPALGIILFQDEGANLVQLGRALRARIDELEAEFTPYGIGFGIGFDAAETVEEQMDRLGGLALSGFIIALLVLYLFLREARAVAVVAVAVPMSLLMAGAMLYLGGFSLNIITLSGLAVGVGMLIDNSIVVYEAVQRNLERGLAPEQAAVAGISGTVRAILTACFTTAVVFLPATFLVESAFARGVLILVSVAILLPLLASLLVATFLVPLLAHRLAAPAALARLRRGAAQGGAGRMSARQPARVLFTGLLKNALRRPTPWVAGTTAVVLLTLMIALPWVLVRTLGEQAGDTDEVRLTVEMEGSNSLEAASLIFARLEQAALDLTGVEGVNATIQEDSGSLTVFLLPEDERPADTDAFRVRRAVYDAAEGLSGVVVDPASLTGQGGDGDGGSLLGGGGAEILVSGPDMAQLYRLAEDIRARLEAVPGVDSTSLSGRRGQEELRVSPIAAALDAYRLYPEVVLEALRVLRREGTQMQVGFTLPDGREIPLSLRRREESTTRAAALIENVRIPSGAGALPLGELTTVSRQPPAPSIVHSDGRRALTLSFRLDDDAPESGPARVNLDARIQAAVQGTYFPDGYSVETPGDTDSGSLIGTLFLPMLLLLFAVLAIAFESLTLPLLILLAVPLTILGATWSLVVAGLGADMYAAVGAVALLGLAVNPAILLVDRMQRRRLAGGSPGGAAMGAVRERIRPVLMTSATTIAGLWPLALVTGNELEVWPPFATVIIGGLSTATLLTLLIIPLGFVALSRLDGLFARLGPWGLMAWAAVTALLMAPLVLSGLIITFYWQFVTTVLIAGALLWPARRLLAREPPAPLDTRAMSLEVRCLGKTYGLPGPVSRAVRAAGEASRDLFALAPRDRAEKVLAQGLLGLAAAYLCITLDSVWTLLFAYLAGWFVSRALIEVYRLNVLLRRRPAAGADFSMQTLIARDRRLEGALLYTGPWIVLAVLAGYYALLPRLMDEPLRDPVPSLVFLILGGVTVLLQAGRFTAGRRAKQGTESNEERMPVWRQAWGRFCDTCFGLGLEQNGFTALDGVSFKAEQGMIGILGPNGAGKTTLLRLLAGVLEPTSGTRHFAGRESRGIDAATLSGLIGYLPQEFGLPDHLSAEDYLNYYAILYQVGDPDTRRQRVDQLLKDVGLAERRHDRIGGYSGGMRQRVAVARTLLRLPPVIIVDEPTVGLDPRERIRFRNLLARLAEGRVVLFSTHVVEDVAVSCARVVVLAGGRIVYDDEPTRLAELARGRVWELNATPGAEADLAPGARVIDQVPAADGGARLRILCPRSPHPCAQPVTPTLEDGYLQLQREGQAKPPEREDDHE